MTENQSKKDKKWLFFAIGLVMGFLIAAVTFVVFAMLQDKSKSFTQTIEHIYNPGNDKDTVVKYVTVTQKTPALSVADVQVQCQDSVGVTEVPENYDEVDFSYVENKSTAASDVVVEDRIIAQKKILLKFKNIDFQDIPSEEGALTELEVQQWNTPIKNKISYHFVGNMLQIKGIEIDGVDIIYYDQHYYLCHHGNYYLLENNSAFERLGVVHALPAQK